METKRLKKCRRAFRKQVVEITMNTDILIQLKCKYCIKENSFNISIAALYCLFIKAGENILFSKNMQMRLSYNVSFDYP